jgi:L-malate glycosyltransferase
MRVLYVNHTSAVSGAERSLLELLRGLPRSVRPSVACPPGPLAERVEALGVPHHPLRGTAGSLKVHAWHTTRAVVEMALDAVEVRALSRRMAVDVVHANSIRSGLVAVPPARLGGAPVVVHVRDALPDGAFAGGARRLIGAGADVVISNSAYTAERFGADRMRAVSRVVHNPVDLERFEPSHFDREDARARLGLPPEVPVLAVLAQLTPWKAQDDAVRALHGLSEAGVNARLLLVGSAKFAARATRYDNPTYVRSLEQLVERLGVGERVSFLGERDDVPELLHAVDVVLVPSWEEPFGRAVGEAMAMEVPVVATSVGGPAELIDDGVEGLLLPPRRPEAWAAALEGLLRDRGRRERMGRAGRARASAQLGVERHVEAVLAAYREAISPRRPRTPVASAPNPP